MAVDAFSGAGGASCGLRDAGYDVVALEKWADAADTHDANHERPVLRVDLSTFDWSTLGTLIEQGRAATVGSDPLDAAASLGELSHPAAQDWAPLSLPWLMWASPPCQPFSAAGDQEGEFDDRDGFPWLLAAVKELLPPVVITENVKGLTFAKHDAYFGSILRRLRILGYDVQWRILDCADQGVPQNRERTIIIARRDGGRIVWPAPTHTEHAGLFTQRWVPMADAIPRLKGYGWTLHTNRDQREDGTTQTRPVDEPAPALTAKSGGQWFLERPATTVACDPRIMAPGRHDPNESGSQMKNAVRLEVHELAALQAFPPDYRWRGTKTSVCSQIGNACPPPLVEALTRANRPVEVTR
jgi:DNA (cytosine-5)-methyltransferase 1